MKNLIKDQKGQALVEFALVFCIYLAVLCIFLIHGLWLYNSYQTDRAARHAVVYLATTNNSSQAENIARNHLNNTMVASQIKDVRVYWNGQQPTARVSTEMATFFPGVTKMLDPSSPKWSGKVTITKEAVAPGEHKFTHSHEYR
ncbi:TadE/TadG family type IV pilus assembly protein [Desulfofalx alkaliphila]|uniref:TadE/TadG family type IV pilus assembly protein n=1 Tax=Desulfofalx alkaliphila TaxID=105483 RepID=UPI0004E173FD|nr:TadE/TadG family type IV pilus assembly protein [Desulfofalx alkaliphila]